jgi:hypothetical protein
MSREIMFEVEGEPASVNVSGNLLFAADGDPQTILALDTESVVIGWLPKGEEVSPMVARSGSQESELQLLAAIMGTLAHNMPAVLFVDAITDVVEYAARQTYGDEDYKAALDIVNRKALDEESGEEWKT